MKPSAILSFGERLRLTLGKDTQQEFADKCGLSLNAIRNYLNGSTYPTLDRFDAIANAGDVNLTWLLTGEGPMRKGDAAPVPQTQEYPHPPQTSDPSQSAPYAAFDALEVVEGMGMLTQIYSSGDTTYIRAINANLMAFSDAIVMKKSNEDMQSRIKTLENNLAILEEKLNKLLEVRQKVVNGS